MLRVVVGLLISSFVGIILVASPAHASTPESCFAFDGSSGTITAYYDNEGNNSSNPACPRDIEVPATIGGVGVTSLGDWALYNKALTSVVIPGSVTTIGNWAFSTNQLTSVTIPDSVTSIDDYAFGNNQLDSLTIPSSVTSVGDYAFTNNQLTSVTIPDSLTSLADGMFNYNRLTSVSIPDSITSIGYDTFAFNRLTNVELPMSMQTVRPTAFGGQNTWGRAGDSSNPSYDLFGGDLSVVQYVYDNMWYARLYTSNPSNPENLLDGAMSENWYTGDVNQNGNLRDPVGGHLINPASVTIRYQDQQGHQLRTPVQYTGVHTSDDSYLTDYSITTSGIQAPLDPTSPTSQESADLAAGFAQYYRGGQTKTFVAPDITGYTTPSDKSITFNPGSNTLTFVYQAIGSGTTPTVSVNSSKAITQTPTIPSRPTFSGVAASGATVVVTVHSNPITCTTIADIHGNWTCTLPKSLPAGNHTVYVKVTNPDSSVQNLGPYAVVVRASGGATINNTTPLAPNSGVSRSIVVQPWVGMLAIGAILLLGSRILAHRISR